MLVNRCGFKNKNVMELSKEQIAKINKLSPMQWQGNKQGIFTEPYGIPNHIKEPVIYMRWETGGTSGGSCWENSNPQHYKSEKGKPKFECVDLVLKELMPNISFLQFREIEKLIQSSQKTDCEYYGNSTDFEIEFIVLSELISKLEEFSNENN